jgi:hypothetical protein
MAIYRQRFDCISLYLIIYKSPDPENRKEDRTAKYDEKRCVHILELEYGGKSQSARDETIGCVKGFNCNYNSLSSFWLLLWFSP